MWNKPDIVIKEADKGGAVTVLSKNHYMAMTYEHLNNQKTNQKVDKNLNPTIMKFFFKPIKQKQKYFHR